MAQSRTERARALAQNLVEVLTSYEEELIALERETPAMSHLRRAVSMTIAEACYWVSDQSAGPADWSLSAAEPPRRAN
jgi:hypothetical protein